MDVLRTYNRSTCSCFWMPRATKLPKNSLDEALRDLRRFVSVAVRNAKQDSSKGSWLTTGGYNDVYHCSWHKDTEEACGVAQIQLLPRKKYDELLQPGDLLILFMGNDFGGTGDVLVSLLLIDSVKEDINVENDTTVKIYLLSAKDVGEVPLETSTVVDQAFVGVTTVANSYYNEKFFENLVGQRAGSPCEQLLTALDVFYNAELTGNQIVRDQYRLPGLENTSIMSLIDMKTFVQAPMFGYAVPGPLDPAAAGNVWRLMQTLANRCVNELFIDVRDVSDKNAAAAVRHAENVTSAYLSSEDVQTQQRTRDTIAAHFAPRLLSNIETQDLHRDSANRSVLALVFRQQPYDTDTFQRLPLVELDARETSSYEVTRSKNDVKNLFTLRTPSLPQLEQEYVYGVKINRESISKFGIKRMESETIYPLSSSDLALSYAQGSKHVTAIEPAVYSYFIGIISTWYAYNERFLGGSISCRFRPDIRVGTRLRYTKRQGLLGEGPVEKYVEFYVQGVNHVFSANEGSSYSSLTVVRGVEQDAARVLPEAHLYWTKRGSRLPQDPYIILNETALEGAGAAEDDIATGGTSVTLPSSVGSFVSGRN